MYIRSRSVQHNHIKYCLTMAYRPSNNGYFSFVLTRGLHISSGREFVIHTTSRRAFLEPLEAVIKT